MTDSPDLFAHRNRGRIVTLVVLATFNYMLAVALAAVAVTLGTIILTIFKLEILPDDADTLRVMGIGIGAILAGAFVVGFVVALFRIPFARRSLERRVLAETGAVVSTPTIHRELRNLLDGLAIAGGIPAPRFAVISRSRHRTRSAWAPDPRTRSSASRRASRSSSPGTSSKRCWPTR